MNCSSRLVRSLRIFLPLVLVAIWPVQAVSKSDAAPQPESRQRLLVLTDIEADPDDAQTFVRLLHYANQIDIEGVVPTTSVHQKTMVAPETLEKIIDAYNAVRDNLLKHEKGYPKASQLQSLVKSGLAVYGMDGVGPDKDSEGSDWIIKVLERDDDRPLWVSVWGGPNVLAQALYRLRETKSEAELKELIAKLRVYTISDQDDSAAWIRQNFPELFYVVSPGGYGAATWTGISAVIDGIDNATISNEWLASNIQQSHGPLGAQYPDVAYGMEGDTPAWLNLIPNGLSVPERPDWGGWGGRYELYTPELQDLDPEGFTGGVPVEAETRPIWTNAVDTYTPSRASSFGRSIKAGEQFFTDYRATLWRWRDELQNDFAARIDWGVKSYDDANHPPVVVLNHSEQMSIKSGSYFHLDARGTHDPDGDSLTYWWFNYPEVGSMKDAVAINSAENMVRVHVRAPEVQQPQQLHFIVKVTDRGLPPLTRYKRVIVTVEP
ncbi:DUF1593 domain-containing protein [Gilvimarinus agarilyticus]|uniref:DUF1593 domain-containing protein n=1 Tax=Gilvimarinus agarilyticus TaxID=679259 RepID=UPI000A9B866B|nr:DUF1593 domain-containing protein [Gilvimarinus agarilyticus]